MKTLGTGPSHDYVGSRKVDAVRDLLLLDVLADVGAVSLDRRKAAIDSTEKVEPGEPQTEGQSPRPTEEIDAVWDRPEG